MTRKDFKAMAKLFHDTFEEFKLSPEVTIIAFMMREYMRIAKQSNPRFDEEQFKRAVNYEDVFTLKH